MNDVSSEACVDSLSQRIAARFGVDFSGFRRVNLLDAIANVRGRTNSACAELLSAPDADLAHVVEAACNSETYFLRHPDQLAAIRDEVFVDLARTRSRTRRLRIWSAGCASGEEPLTLAMLVRESPLFIDWDIEILATDLSRPALDRAAEAVYSAWSFRAVPPEVQARWFVRIGERFTPSPALRAMVRFERHNLLDGPPGVFDLVLCRNVLIYFSEDGLRVATQTLSAALAPDGFLLVGPAECRLDLFPTLESRPLPSVTLLTTRHTPIVESVPAPRLRSSRRPPRRISGPLRFDVRDSLVHARARADRGDIDGASKLIDSVLSHAPRNAEAHVIRAMLARERGDRPEAIRAALAALEVDPDMAFANMILGELHRAAGRSDAAANCFADALRSLDGKRPTDHVAGTDIPVADLAAILRKLLATLGEKGQLR